MSMQKPPLFRRHVRNLLVTGHRSSRLPKNEAARKCVYDALEEVMMAFGKVAKDKEAQIRILTGFAEGTDETAAAIASRYGLPLHVIAPSRPPKLAEAYCKAERIARVGKKQEGPSPDTWVAATDQTRLALADAMIIVWDGMPPQGHAGGSVRMLVEAIRQFTPVVCIDARPGSAGRVRALDPGKFNAQTLARLSADEGNVGPLHEHFEDVATDDLQSALDRLVTPFWSLDNIRELDEALQEDRIDPGKRPTCAGIVHSWFLGFLGPWKFKKRQAVTAWRGPKGFDSASGLPEGVWVWFDRLDRAATHAASKHRDQIVLIHLLSSLAVLGAVAGTIDWLALGAAYWGMHELIVLAGIGLLVWRNQHQSMTVHSAWMHFRQAAEAFRMSALLHPFLASLPALYRGVWRREDRPVALAKPYQWLVIQLLREAGPPKGKSHCLEIKCRELKAGLISLIDDQLDYHMKNHEVTHATHHHLHRLTQSVFLLVVAAVLIHLYALGVHSLEHRGFNLSEGLSHSANWIHEQGWMLLITAFFPALAAGLHGIMTKLELQRVAKSSQSMHKNLQTLKQAVEDLQPKDDPMALRALALETVITMYAEHEAWAELMQDQGLEIPG